MQSAQMQPAVAVVIPMWDSARFIERAVRSVLDQPAGERLTVVCADDGSADETVNICRRLAERDGRVRVLAGPHRGVSAARNAGMLAAEAPYIGFLDSDDRWEDGFFDRTVLEMLDGSADMVGFGWQTADQHLVPIRRFDSADVVMPGGYEAVRAGERHFACYLYSRTLLTRYRLLFCPQVQFNEDEVFRAMCLYRAERVRLSSRMIFSNLLREDSLRHRRFAGMGADHLFRVWRYAWEYFYRLAPEDGAILRYCLEKLDKFIPKMRQMGEMTPELEAVYARMCRLSGDDGERAASR